MFVRGKLLIIWMNGYERNYIHILWQEFLCSMKIYAISVVQVIFCGYLQIAESVPIYSLFCLFVHFSSFISLSLYVVVMSLSGKDNNYILSIWLCCVNFQHWFYYEGNKNFMYARSATGIYIPTVFYQQYIHRNKEIVGSNQNLWVWCLILSLLKALANWGHRLI